MDGRPRPLLHDASLVYLGLFLAALIDATGFPFPGRALLVAAGAATARDWGQVAADDRGGRARRRRR